MDVSFLSKIEEVDISILNKNPDNPRKINKKNFNELKISIKKFPQMMGIRPVVIDNNNMILGGNQRYEACIDLGWNKIPVIVERQWLQLKKMVVFVMELN